MIPQELLKIFLLTGMLHISWGGHLKMKWYHVVSGVRLRYATTHIRTAIENTGPFEEEYNFVGFFPETALLTNFSMEMDQYLSIATVNEIQKPSNLSQMMNLMKIREASIIAKDSKIFSTKVKIPPGKTVLFELTYEELLQRKHGVYRHTLNVLPDMFVDNIRVLVRITEHQRIKRNGLHVPVYGSNLDTLTNIELLRLPIERRATLQTSTSLYVSAADVFFEPTEPGQLVVLYDVERHANAGDFEVINGFFTHFFAPKPEGTVFGGNKNVILLIDTSFTMQDGRWDQILIAVDGILRSLETADFFNILTFNTKVSSMFLASRRVSDLTITDAMDFLTDIDTRGGTNLYEGLTVALDMLRIDESQVSTSLLYVITDGKPTAGVTNEKMLLNSLQAINGKPDPFSIHSVGLGSDSAFRLLRKISSQNRGIARQFFNETSLANQILGFFHETCRPILQNLVVRYMDANNMMKSVVSQQHVVSRDFHEGGEIILAGKIAPGLEKPLEIRVVGQNGAGETVHLRSQSQLSTPGEIGDNHEIIERIWAFLSIKHLQQLGDEVYDEALLKAVRKRIIDLCLKYNFVAENVTSLNVVPLIVEEKKTFVELDRAPVQVDGKWFFVPPVGGPDFNEADTFAPFQNSAIDPLQEKPTENNSDGLVATGQLMEEGVVRMDEIERARRGPILAEKGRVDDNNIAVDHLVDMSLDQLIWAANPNDTIRGISLTEHFGPATDILQGFYVIPAILDPGTKHLLDDSQEPTRCHHQRQDIIFALDTGGGVSRQYGLAGPGSRFLLKNLAARTIALLAFSQRETRVGLIAFHGSPSRSNLIYTLDQNQNPNAVLRIVDEINPGIVRFPADNLFRLTYKAFKKAQDGKERRTILVLLSGEETFGRFKGASAALRNRNVRIISAAPHQRNPDKLQSIQHIVGTEDPNNQVIVQPNPYKLLDAICRR